MSEPFMTDSEFIKKLGIPHMFYLRFYELEQHLKQKFGYFDNWTIEEDGECNGTVSPEIIEYVRKITMGAIIKIEIVWGEEQSYDGSITDYAGAIYTPIEGEELWVGQCSDCLFLADEEGAIGPIFFPNWYELEGRAEDRHYREEREAHLRGDY